MVLLRVLMVEPGMTVLLLQAVSAISDRLSEGKLFFHVGILVSLIGVV